MPPLLYKNEPVQDGSVLAGLILLEHVSPPGTTYTAAEIAAVCGVSHQAINHIEKRAIRKLKQAFIDNLKRKGITMPETDSELTEAIWAVLGTGHVKATDITYPAAVELISRLADVPDCGLCIVTAAAAGRKHEECAAATSADPA